MRYRIFAAAWILVLVLPFVLPRYTTSLLNLTLINVILVASLNLVMGYGGQLSLAQAGFFGLGAYTSGVLSVRYGISPWVGVVAAIVLTAVISYIVGKPTLRLRGNYLAMATLGLNAILSVLFVNLRDVTGGPNGLSGVPSLQAGSIAFDNDARFSVLAWLGATITLLVVRNLVDSRVGRALRALGESEVAAASLGVDTQRYKLRTFIVAAACAGLAGSLYVHYLNFASPETFDFAASVMLVVAVAIGGIRSFFGPLIGAVIITILPELLRETHDLEVLVFGVSLVVILVFFPRGLAGIAARRATS